MNLVGRSKLSSWLEVPAWQDLLSSWSYMQHVAFLLLKTLPRMLPLPVFGCSMVLLQQQLSFWVLCSSTYHWIIISATLCILLTSHDIALNLPHLLPALDLHRVVVLPQIDPTICQHPLVPTRLPQPLNLKANGKLHNIPAWEADGQQSIASQSIALVTSKTCLSLLLLVARPSEAK